MLLWDVVVTTAVSCGDATVHSGYVLNATIDRLAQSTDAEQCYCLLYHPVGTRWLSNLTVDVTYLSNAGTREVHWRTLDHCDALYTNNRQWPVGIKFLYTGSGRPGTQPSLTFYTDDGMEGATLPSASRYIITSSHADFLRLNCDADNFHDPQIQSGVDVIATYATADDNCKNAATDDDNRITPLSAAASSVVIFIVLVFLIAIYCCTRRVVTVED